MKTINYNVTILGCMMVPDNATDEEIKELILGDYWNFEPNDVDWHDAPEDLDFENEYEVICFNDEGKAIHEYSIEADTIVGAVTAAEEFCKHDCPKETLRTVRVLIGDTYEEFDIAIGGLV